MTNSKYKIHFVTYPDVASIQYLRKSCLVFHVLMPNGNISVYSKNHVIGVEMFQYNLGLVCLSFIFMCVEVYAQLHLVTTGALGTLIFL